MKKSKYSPFLLLAFLSCFHIQVYSQKTHKKVVLHGTIKNYRNIIEVKENGDTEPFQFGSNTKTFLPDSNGQFSIEFSLSRPNYFRVARNLIYLSPGENLEVILDYDNAESSTFKGKHSQENIYLKSTPYPKAGSFLEGGANLKPDIDQTIKLILGLADKRKQLLHSNKKLSHKFKYLEDNRIDADILNSIYRIATYYPYVYKLKGDSLKNFENYFLNALDSIVKSAVSIRLDPKLLDLEVYRNMIPMINRLFRTNKKYTQEIDDWLFAQKIMNEMQVTADQNDMIAFEDKIKGIETVIYRNEVQNSFKKLLGYKGDVAADIIFSDTKNNSIKLSKFRGQVIFIDVWATWCGPCIKEQPYLDTLRNRYKDNPNIVFLSLSIDTDIDKWVKYITKLKHSSFQYQTDLSTLKPYYVSEIPRTIIIDKNFKVFSLRGPAPSDPEVNNIIHHIIQAD